MQSNNPRISNRTELAAYLGICTKTLTKIIKEAGIYVKPQIALSGDVIQRIIDAFDNRHKPKDDDEQGSAPAPDHNSRDK